MKYVAQVTDSGPLSFRSGRETTTSETLSYVPGTALFGGLAAAHAALRRDAEQFNAFFMDEAASFGNLYPADFRHDDLKDAAAEVAPFPRTAVSCKRFGGFRLDELDPVDDPHHGVYDALIAWTAFALSGERDTTLLNALKVCPDCGETLDHIEGYYRRDPWDAEIIGKADVKRGLRTRTGISRTTGTVKQGVLYSRQVLRAGSTFWGTLNIPDEHAIAFREFVEEMNEARLLRLGNNRTRGFGRVTLLLDEVQSTDSADEIGERIEAYNEAMRQTIGATGIAMPHTVYVPLTLRSDTILLDHLLRYRSALTPDYLGEVWGLKGANVIYRNSTTQRVMGWSGLWRLPKADDIAIARGSVFVLGFERPLDDTQLKALLTMEDRGLGVRTREGFGRLRVADPFHWEVKGV